MSGLRHYALRAAYMRRSATGWKTWSVALVWYSAWQMECCGEPFAVGDSVEWGLTGQLDDGWLEAAIGTKLAAKITHVEDHHDVEVDAVARRGKVLSIRCAYCRYAPMPDGDERTLYPVAGTAKIVSAERVDGTEDRANDLHFNGYLVELDLEPL